MTTGVQRTLRLALALVMPFGLYLPMDIHGWTWPVESIETVVPGMDQERSLPGDYGRPTASPARFLRFRFSDTEMMTVVAPMSGRIIIHGAVPPTTGGETSIVFRDENEFWVVLDTRQFEWFGRDRSVPLGVTSGEGLGTASEIDLSVYDRLNDRYVNPRALFPYVDRFPTDGIPPLRVLQNGRYFEIPRRGSLEVAPGAVQLVSPEGEVDPTRFPKTLYLLQGGLVQQQFSFLFEEEVATYFNETGDFVLLEGEVAEGVTEFELEARRFDGTVERRTIRLEAPRPPSETPQSSP